MISIYYYKIKKVLLLGIVFYFGYWLTLVQRSLKII